MDDFSIQSHNSDCIQISSLVSWQKSDLESDSDESQSFESRRFDIVPSINSKIYLWKGDIIKLAVDCVVNPTNEAMNESEGVSGRIMQFGGDGLYAEVRAQDGLTAGECKVTNGHNLLARKVIHTVGPKYNSKYQFAADHALHMCYRSSLHSLIEYKLRTIAFPIVQLHNKAHPKEYSTHIALRTARRFLEKYAKHVDAIVFCLDNNDDYKIYSDLLSVYFPRNFSETTLSKNLPEDIGDENGEPIVEDRKIRIEAFPGTMDVPTGTINSMSIRASGLSEMSDSPDIARREKMVSDPDAMEIYRRYALTPVDKEEMRKLDVIYNSGVDSKGRPILVVVGKNIPENEDVLDRYSKNIYKLYIVHPTFWLKLFFTVLSPILSKQLKERMEYKSDLKEMFQSIPQKVLKIRREVYKFDEVECGNPWISGENDL